MTELLDAVDALTMPVRRRQRQDIIQRTTTKDADDVETEHLKVTGQQTITVELPPLLRQLDDAIRSSMGGSTPGAKLASEGSVLNVAALYEAIRIGSLIRDWCRAVQVRPVKDDTGRSLRAWYAASLAHPMSAEVESFHRTKLEGWARTIRGMLDPWREKDLPDPCPVCGATEWWDMTTRSKFLRPLIVKYRPDGADMLARAYGMCRACTQVWSVRELAYELEQQTARHAEESG